MLARLRHFLRHLFLGTLRRQLILGVALVYAVLTSLFVWDITTRQRDLLLERQTEQAQALAQSVATSTAGWVAARDLVGLQEIVIAQARYPELHYAMILDCSGRVLAHSDTGRVGQYLRDLPACDHAADGGRVRVLSSGAALVDVAAHVMLAGRPLGWVRVGLGQQVAAARLAEITRDGLLYALAAILIGALLAWVMGNRITRRLRAVQEVTDAVRAGDESRRVPIRGEDEAAHLAQAFNTMLDGLAASRAELVGAEQRWLMALEGSGLGVWDWNAATGKIFFSHQWKAMLGYADHEVGDGLNEWTDRVHADDLAGCQADQERHFRGETPFYRNEHRMRARDGSWRWVLDQGMVFERSADGKPLRLVGTHTDVTERRAARERDRLFRGTMETSLMGIYIVQDLRFRYVNPAFAALFGDAPQEMIDRVGPLDGVVPEQREQVAENLRQRAAGGPGQPYEIKCVRKDGSTFDLLVWGKGVEYEGRPAIVGTAVDISERKAMEAELEAHRDHLEDLVAKRTAQLVAAREEAERLMRVKRDFLANMSHEIRTPLNAVLGFARIGVRDSAGRASQETFARIQDAGEHLLGVINDILDYSRLEAGKVAVEFHPFQLAAVLDHAASFVAAAAARKGLAFVVDAAPDLPEWATGDAQRLQQILTNLLSNAVKFTATGEVRLRVAREGDDTFFRVIDSGIGMSAEQVARLFRPFEQADNSTTRRYGGSGLGLAISHDLAHLLGGEITVDSAPDRGSAFTLRLPLPAAQPALPEHAAAAPTGPRLSGIRVLAAEDVEVNRRILEDLLVHEGAQVVFAENGRQALERLQEMGAGAFDVVLMDVQMPVMDGFEATRRMRELAPALPVIGLTAHTMAEERRSCLAAGMAEQVAKPIDVQALVVAVLRQTRSASGAQGGEAAPAPPDSATSAQPAAIIDRQALLERFPGRQAFVDRLLASVLESQAETPAQLRAAAGGKDLVAIAFLAHSLRGMAGNVAAQDLQELATRTEAAARADGDEALDLALDLAHQLADRLSELLSELERQARTGG